MQISCRSLPLLKFLASYQPRQSPPPNPAPFPSLPPSSLPSHPPTPHHVSFAHSYFKRKLAENVASVPFPIHCSLILVLPPFLLRTTPTTLQIVLNLPCSLLATCKKKKKKKNSFLLVFSKFTSSSHPLHIAPSRPSLPPSPSPPSRSSFFFRTSSHPG